MSQTSDTIMSIATLVGSIAAAWVSIRTNKKVEIVHQATNSLAERAEAAARAQGVLQGAADEKAEQGTVAKVGEDNRARGYLQGVASQKITQDTQGKAEEAARARGHLQGVEDERAEQGSLARPPRKRQEPPQRPGVHTVKRAARPRR